MYCNISHLSNPTHIPFQILPYFVPQLHSKIPPRHLLAPFLPFFFKNVFYFKFNLFSPSTFITSMPFHLLIFLPHHHNKYIVLPPILSWTYSHQALDLITPLILLLSWIPVTFLEPNLMATSLVHSYCLYRQHWHNALPLEAFSFGFWNNSVSSLSDLTSWLVCLFVCLFSLLILPHLSTL